MRRVVAIAALALALTPAVASAGVYGGASSRGDPIAITVGKSGNVKRIGTSWVAECDSGKRYPFGGILVSATKRPSVLAPGDYTLLGSIKKGKLKATGVGADAFDDGSGALITQRIRGTFKRTTAAGTWSAHVNIVDPEGNTVDNCDTGKVRWSARRGPTVYGGSTTQGEPVVVETASSRARITYFGIVWYASCEPAGFAQFADPLAGFALTEGGAFGDQWTSDYPYGDGTKDSFSYELHGTLKKHRGSGTFSVDLKELDAQGTPTITCRTNPIRWSVTQ